MAPRIATEQAVFRAADELVKEGKMTDVTEDGIILEEAVGKNRNKQLINHTFLFNNIKTTRIQTVF